MKKIVFVFLLGVFSLQAQITTSTIKGLVIDGKNAPLPGAEVIVLHQPTGSVSGAVVQNNGRYTVPNLRVGGPYQITISYIGFKSQVSEGIFLTLGKTTNINGILTEDGESLDEVVISSTNSKVFNNDRTGAQTSVSSGQLKTLPTISRSASDFTRLEPTASGNSFGGRNDQFNNFSLDGAIFNNPFGLDSPTPGGQTGAQPISLDAIEQISVSVAPYDVTLSGFTGASVNAVTKSGTNEFHGTVYGFFRNEDLTGGKVRGDDIAKADLSQQQYGFSLGGPIIKNKLFFFANLEVDDRTDLGSQGWIPRNGEIDAINESRVLEDDLIDVSDALANLGYDTGAYEGFNYDSESIKGIFKLDLNINDNNRLSFIYNFLRASKENPAHPTALGVRGPSFQTLQFENSGYEINNNIDSFQIELNSTITDKITNKLQSGYTHFDDFRNPLSTPAPSIIIEEDGTNYIIAGHEPFSINNRLDQKVFQISNNTNFFLGDHTLTAGLSFEKFEFDNSFNLGVYGGTFGFPVVNTETGEDEFRNFESVEEFLDYVDEGGLIDGQLSAAEAFFEANNALPDGEGWQLAETNVGQAAFYLQDEWNVIDDLKLTFGVRFDKPLYFDTQEKIEENIARKIDNYQPDNIYFDPETGNEVTIDSRTLPNNDILFSPRFGFNWDVNGEGVTQIRGGTGKFTGRLPFVWLGNQVQGVDFFFYQAVDPDFKWPQVWRTSLGVDHKLENGIIASVDLSYTEDRNGIHVQNWGLADPSGTLDAPGDQRAYYLETDKALNAFGGTTNAYVFTNSENKGKIWNATVKLQKSFNNGLYTSLAYNFLDARDVNSIEAEITGDAFDFNPVVGNANNDVLSYSRYGDRHRFIGVASKKFTFFGENFPTTLSTFFEYAQGGRFNYTYAGNINGDSSFQNNDLLYIPTSDEINDMQFVEVAETPTTPAITPQDQRTALEAYIEQDDYLSENRGDYMERYGALAPWRSRWDLKFLQDFKVAKNSDNKIQLSVDILNIGNLLNSNWGLVQQVANQSPISVVGIDDDLVPTYFFDPEQTETFVYDSSLNSRWQMQVGLRYIF